MDILKRVINLIFAILIMAFTLLMFFDNSSGVSSNDWVVFFKFVGVVSLIFAVINFSLFKKFTIWNK